MFIPNKKKIRKQKKITKMTFSELNDIINIFLKSDNKEQINVNGLFSIIQEYFNVDKDNLPQIHYIMIASNSWSEYLCDCMEYLNYIIYTKELQKDYITSFLKKLKKGQVKDDKYLKLEKHIANLTKIIIKMKLFCSYLLSEQKYTINISICCKNLYNDGINNLLYKNIEDDSYY